MAIDWRRYCRAMDFDIEGNFITVRLLDERRHRIRVEDVGDVLQLSAVVVGGSIAGAVAGLPLKTWQRNRGSELVGFGIDHKGRLIGSCWVPKPGLTDHELQLYVRTLAVECD